MQLSPNIDVADRISPKKDLNNNILEQQAQLTEEKVHDSHAEIKELTKRGPQAISTKQIA